MSRESVREKVSTDRRMSGEVREEEWKGTTHETTVLEQPQQIVVLSVDVSAHLYRCFQLEKDGLRDEDCSDITASEAEKSLG